MKLVTSVLGGIGFGVIVSLFTLSGCGGDKSAPGGTTGGASSSVGGEGNGGGSTSTNTSAGGSTSNAGAATGGSTSGPKVVPRPLMTDFSEVADGTVVNSSTQSFDWGDKTKGLTGGTFNYGQDPSPTFADSPTGTITGGALNITAAVAAGHYSGFGFYFGPNEGSDASAYTGFSFTIAGDLGGSTVDIQMQMTPDYPLNDNNKGTCDYLTAGADKWSYCKNPHVAMTSILTAGVTTTAQTVQVPWTLLVGGNPVSDIDPHQLLGIQLQFNCGTTACPVNVTIDDLTFY